MPCPAANASLETALLPKTETVLGRHHIAAARVEAFTGFPEISARMLEKLDQVS